MIVDTVFAAKVFAGLFAIMNPIANVPLFLSLTEGRSPQDQRRVAVTTIIGVTVGCVVSAIAGSTILGIFGVTIDDFRLAGGLMLLLIALSMLHGTPSRQHQPAPGEAPDPASSPAIYPLTIPLLVGPGTIATLIVFGHTAVEQGAEISFAIGLGGLLIVLAAALLGAPTLGRFLSPQVTAIAQRLMGMILASIAVGMMVTSLRATLTG